MCAVKTAGNLQPGDHVVSPRRHRKIPYTHHGIVVAVSPEIRVIHYLGFCEAGQSGPVKETSIQHFAQGCGFYVQAEPVAAFDRAEIVARAQSRLGEDKYRLLWNNCEHFTTWCIHDTHRSRQVERGAEYVGGGVIGGGLFWKLGRTYGPAVVGSAWCGIKAGAVIVAGSPAVPVLLATGGCAVAGYYVYRRCARTAEAAA